MLIFHLSIIAIKLKSKSFIPSIVKCCQAAGKHETIQESPILKTDILYYEMKTFKVEQEYLQAKNMTFV